MKIKTQNPQAAEGKAGTSFDYYQRKQSAKEGSTFKEFDEETSMFRSPSNKKEKKSAEITSNMVGSSFVGLLRGASLRCINRKHVDTKLQIEDVD